jgi:hypothetical protein
MAAEQIKSLSITNSDAIPQVPNSAAQGAVARYVVVDDQVACAATPLQSAKSFYRLIRVPTQAIIKSFVIATDAALDTGSHALVMDFNVAWADGTTPNLCPTQFQLASLGLAATEAVIPTTANDGTTTTTIAAYSAPNLLFGQVTMAPTSIALAPIEKMLNGVTATYTMLKITQQPLWQTLGFVDGRGNPVDPGGYFDIIAYVSTGAGTGGAGNLYAKLAYAY